MTPNPLDSKPHRRKGPCLLQQQIIEEIQLHLIRLAELSRAAAAALDNRNENVAHQIDNEIERELGAKERGMGKLEAHREEHGC